MRIIDGRTPQQGDYSCRILHQTGGFAVAATLGQPRIATADNNAALAFAAGVMAKNVRARESFGLKNKL